MRDIRWLPEILNNGDKITRGVRFKDLFGNQEFWFKPPHEFKEGVPMFKCDQC